MTWPGVMMTSRSTMLRSSRTLPGQSYTMKEPIASPESVFERFPYSAENVLRKCSTRSGMSSRRRRRGGTSTGMTFSR